MSKNIILIVENMKEFFINYQKNIKDLNLSSEISNLLELDHPIEILDDVKNYLILIISKNNLMTINQYKIINECCLFHEKFNVNLKIILGKNQ